ncbi:microfibril-associated glycoprotein 4-like [Argopecten irradians]|uniref:microfibril-associated glycoprotein 4-like n=1 Tax=Argopecten irradians TaxID=31199 RepID=UPI0037160AFE
MEETEIRSNVICVNSVFVCFILTMVFQLNLAVITDSKYKVVTKPIIQNHAGSLITTSTWSTKVGCASSCGDSSTCLSFSYEPANGECKMYSDEVCYRDDGVTSSTITYYTKVINFANLANCGDIPTTHCSGVYTLALSTNIDVYCDMDTAGGPWTVFANRFDGSVDFYRGWSEYKNGFGNLTGEFWLGFDKLRTVLAAQTMKLRIAMEGYDGSSRYGEYSTFAIADEASNYRLTVSTFNAPDGLFNGLSYHSGRSFSTFDRDNDSNGAGSCAEAAHGAWWYAACVDSNLFGNYTSEPGYPSMHWKYFFSSPTSYTPVAAMRMMLIKL